MELYNAIFKITDKVLDGKKPQVWAYNPRKAWPDLGSAELVLQSDAAYELGANGLGSANYICVTSSPDIINKDQVILYGKDLKDIKSDTPFARIVYLRVGVLEGDDDEFYR